MKLLIVETWGCEQSICYDISSEKSKEKIVFSVFDYLLKTFYPDGLPDIIATQKDYTDTFYLLEDFVEKQFDAWKKYEEYQRKLLHDALEVRNNKDYNKVLDCLCKASEQGIFGMIRTMDPIFLIPDKI